MLEELLTREGYRVLRAYSGTEALLLLEERRPDLVLLDLMLPGLSGEEVLPHLAGIPVIVPEDLPACINRWAVMEDGQLNVKNISGQTNQLY